MAKKLAKKLAKKSTLTRVIREDRGELVSEMEPLLLSENCKTRGELNEIVFELVRSATKFRAGLPDGIVEPLCDLVRSMNCYYSNKIEGHDTHPVQIERALAEDYSAEKKQRNLQLESRAHIATQRWIDEGGLTGNVTTRKAVLEVHRRFESALPEELLWVENPDTGERVGVVPGEVRTGYAKVGMHCAISPGAVDRFMIRWEEAYSRLNKFEAVLQCAVAHHRLLWIHPFADGNGRVTRLISYATMLESLDTGGIWSIARGLSRDSKKYKALLAAADIARRNDLDGRGNLSEETTIDFTKFVLETCLDQVYFMADLMDPATLRNRIMDWAKEEERVGGIMENSTRVLAHILTHRELARKDVVEVVGFDARKSRRVTAGLTKRGVITAQSHKTPFRLAFPAALTPNWLPGLYP